METISTANQATESAPAVSVIAGRPDLLTAQKVEVGIILQAMLGTQAALEYMDNNAIARTVAARVLNQPEQRRGRHDDHGIRL